VKNKKNTLELIVPSFRPDINQEVDIIEELIRIKGYDNIPLTEPDRDILKTSFKLPSKNISPHPKVYCFFRIFRDCHLVFY